MRADEARSEPEYETLMRAVIEAERRFQQCKIVECEARRSATGAENDVIAARKAFVDYLVKSQPAIVKEIKGRIG